MATLNFKGKTFVQNHHLAVKYHQLVPKKDKSLTDNVSLNDNLILHGDNLKALKALLPTYAGKVKCIYIDPPYNTGNERWAYNDNVNSPMMQEWLGKVVDREDFTRHDKWLCMMMPRLKLLRELLREDGVIFVSIDDNEVHHLRMLMDEVFQPDNFIATLTWRKKRVRGRGAKLILPQTEYVYIYAKNISNLEIFSEPLTLEMLNEYTFEDEKGKYKLIPLAKSGTSQSPRPHLVYKITAPDGTDIQCPTHQWRWSKETLKREIENNNVVFRKSKSKWKVFSKQRLYNEKGEQREKTPISYYDKYTTTHGTQTIKEIFGEVIFDFPKPYQMIRDFIVWTTSKDNIILDSFAGTAPTAHAVLDLNKEDGGNRKFILVECEDYADRITAERIRRVIKGYSKPSSLRATEGSEAISEIASSQAPRNDKEGLGGTFSYFELGDPIEMESILEGNKLPSFLELARYVFYTATGEEFDPSKVDEKKNFIGDSNEYEVYLFYKPDIEYLKATALTLEKAKSLSLPPSRDLGPYKGKKRLVFAPSKYLDTDYLLEYRIDYCQLPFEIYKLKE